MIWIADSLFIVAGFVGALWYQKRKAKKVYPYEWRCDLGNCRFHVQTKTKEDLKGFIDQHFKFHAEWRP